MQSYADALSAKGYRSFGFDTDMEMDMDMGCTMRRIEKRKGGECVIVGVDVGVGGAEACVRAEGRDVVRKSSGGFSRKFLLIDI